jgi:hypothetical protein
MALDKVIYTVPKTPPLAGEYRDIILQTHNGGPTYIRVLELLGNEKKLRFTPGQVRTIEGLISQIESSGVPRDMSNGILGALIQSGFRVSHEPYAAYQSSTVNMQAIFEYIKKEKLPWTKDSFLAAFRKERTKFQKTMGDESTYQ